MSRLSLFSLPRRETGVPTQAGVRASLAELLELRLSARGLDLRSRRKVMSLLAGGWQSGLHGRGMDFEETRHYQPGDDIRSIDWRVTARSGEPHTKVFREERERPVLLLADYAPSMCFGTRVAFKSVIAARVAALLAWAAAVHGDRVGGVISAADTHYEVRPAGGKRGVLRLIRALLAWQPDFPPPARNHSLAPALARLRRVARPGGLVCLISDFQGLDGEAEKHLKQLARHCDVLGVFVHDPLEARLPPPGFYTVSDGQARLNVDSADQRLRRRYQTAFHQRYLYLENLFRQRGMRLLPLSTEQPIMEALRNGLGRVEAASGLSHAAEINPLYRPID
jgi:uncharacterized protein (DUF58 family)